jgi:uncharacterized protein
MITPALLDRIFADYSLPLDGEHGPAHWARVHEHGAYLAALTGADLEIVQLFAVLHDSRRRTEDYCTTHGQQAADFARTLRGTHLDLDDDRFELLYDACARHTDGETAAAVTVQTCWDADRLDLGRVWITPDPAKLCTEPARDPALIARATRRAQAGFRPAIVDVWLTGR